MIEPDMRNAIYQLHLAGTPQCQISRQFHVAPHTVRTIIRQQGNLPQTVRKDKIHIDPELLRRLYQQCDGWMQRVHEILVEEEGVQVSYPTRASANSGSTGHLPTLCNLNCETRTNVLCGGPVVADAITKVT